MSVQTTYKFSSPVGSPGGIVDLTPHAIDSFLNAENTGVMKFGVGVVRGTRAGIEVKLPVAASTAAVFEGVVVNNRTTEYDLEGVAHLRKGKALGVMRYGRIYVRVATGVSPAYGDAVYLVKSGDEAGYFSNVATNNLAIQGRFLGGVDSASGVAAVELFNAPNGEVGN